MIISPEKHIWLRLVTTPQVARVAGFQVYAVAVPKTAMMPFCVYRRANITRDSTLAGPIFLPLVNLQIATWGKNYDEARELADEVRLALDGRIGTLAGCTIHDMRLVSETDDYLDPSAVGAQLPPAYEVRQLYQIRWGESEG
jgi:hypothetical protein